MHACIHATHTCHPAVQARISGPTHGGPGQGAAADVPAEAGGGAEQQPYVCLWGCCDCGGAPNSRGIAPALWGRLERQTGVPRLWLAVGTGSALSVLVLANILASLVTYARTRTQGHLGEAALLHTTATGTSWGSCTPRTLRSRRSSRRTRKTTSTGPRAQDTLHTRRWLGGPRTDPPLPRPAQAHLLGRLQLPDRDRVLFVVDPESVRTPRACPQTPQRRLLVIVLHGTGCPFTTFSS